MAEHSRCARSPLLAFTRENAVAMRLVSILLLASSGMKGTRRHCFRFGLWRVLPRSSSPLFRRQRALRFSSGGDARASRLCLAQVTPVQLRVATFSDLNNAAR